MQDLSVKWTLVRRMLQAIINMSNKPNKPNKPGMLFDLRTYMQDHELFINLVSLVNQLLRNRVYATPAGMRVVTTILEVLHDQVSQTDLAYFPCWTLLLIAGLCHHQLVSQLPDLSQWYIELYQQHADHRKDIILSAKAAEHSVKSAKTKRVFEGLVRCLETCQHCQHCQPTVQLDNIV